MSNYLHRQEREFGLIVGGVSLLLSGWWLYRGKFATASHVILPVSVLLIALALLIPRALRLPNKAWMLFIGRPFIRIHPVHPGDCFLRTHHPDWSCEKIVWLGPTEPPVWETRLLLGSLFWPPERPASLREDVLGASHVKTSSNERVLA